MIDFNSSYEEKLELAYSMRAKSVFASNTPDELKMIYENTSKETRMIPTRVGDSKVYLYYPEKLTLNMPLYINFHGGGFVREWRENDAIFCCKLLSDNQCLVADIDYRLAPEYPYPTAIYECYDVVKWFFDHAAEIGIDRENIVVGGHSAGGNIATSIAMLANRSGEFRLKYQILDYPGLCSYKSAEEYELVKGAIPPERCNQFRVLSFQKPEDAFDHVASPVLADLEELVGMPDACIITAYIDSLRDDGERFANKLVQAGVSVMMKRFRNSRHGFMINFTDEYEEALRFYSEILQYAFKK